MRGRSQKNFCLAVAIGLVVAIGSGLTLAGSGFRQQSIFLEPEPLDTTEAIPYFIADGTDVPGYEIADPELARAALDAWSRESGGRLRFVESESERGALIRLIWVSGDQGHFGETEHIRVNGKPGAFVYVTPGASQLGRELSVRAGEDKLLRDTIVYLTCVHELGHAVGLGHTDQFADIMYSFGYGGNFTEYFLRYRRQLESRTDIMAHSGLSPSDAAALRALYSSEGY
jgi:hypothetical protein